MFLRVLREDFAGTVVCDRLTTYPAFSRKLQQCWAHIFCEAKNAAEQQQKAEPIYQALTQLHVAPQSSLESDLTLREQAELQRVARRELESLIEQFVPDGSLATLLGKIEGGLNHWHTLVGEPAALPTNNDAENALREPVVLWKTIGTL
jgi:hypothetical protein